MSEEEELDLYSNYQESILKDEDAYLSWQLSCAQEEVEHVTD